MVVAAASAVVGWFILVLGVPPWRRLLAAWLGRLRSGDRTERRDPPLIEPSVLDREFPASGRDAAPPARQRPGLTERLSMTRRLVDARGVILWVQTAGDAEIEVLATAGYGDGLLERPNPIAHDARLLAAAAFADGRLVRRARHGVRLAAAAIPVDHDGVLAGVLTVEFDPEVVTPADEPVRLLCQVALQVAPHLPRAQPPSAVEQALSVFASPAPVESPPATGVSVERRRTAGDRAM